MLLNELKAIAKQCSINDYLTITLNAEYTRFEQDFSLKISEAFGNLGKVVVSVDQLKKCLRAFDAKDQITLNIVDDKLVLKQNVVSMTLDIFEKPPYTPRFFDSSLEHFSCVFNLKLQNLAYISQAISSDTTRPHLNCIKFDAENNRIVACDGHRLHTENFGVDENVMITADTYNFLKGFCNKNSEISIQKSEKSLLIDIKTGIRTSYLKVKYDDTIKFPPYEQIIPGGTSYSNCVNGEKKNLVSSLKKANKVNKVLNKFNNAVTLKTVNGFLSLSSDNLTIDTAVTWDAKTDIGINASYFIDALNCEGVSTIELQDSNLDPITVKTGEKLAVIMLMRI